MPVCYHLLPTLNYGQQRRKYLGQQQVLLEVTQLQWSIN
jgi:hypothetical protein